MLASIPLLVPLLLSPEPVFCNVVSLDDALHLIKHNLVSVLYHLLAHFLVVLGLYLH